MRTLLRCLRVVAMCALVAMMAVTVLDVSMRLVVNELVLGSVELVQLTLVLVVFLALPETFGRDEQITVDLVDQFLVPRTVGRLRMAAAVVTALFLVALAWRTFPPALATLEIGDITSDLKISLFWYWLPIVIGSVAAAVTAMVVLARPGRLGGFGTDAGAAASTPPDAAGARGAAPAPGGRPGRGSDVEGGVS